MGDRELDAQYQKQVERTRFMKEAVYDPLKESWDNYRAIQVEQDGIFLKTLASLSAGAFGVSFAFINGLIEIDNAGYKSVLVASWVFFTLAIVLVLSCHLVSSFIHGQRCDDIKKDISEGYEGKPYSAKERWYYGRVISILELSAFCSFLGGLGCLVSFVRLNI